MGDRRLQNPAQVVSWLGGVQAQDYRWAKWSIGVRAQRCDDTAVERAITERSIVRTWMMRGTLHFVAAGDLAWLTALLAPGIIQGNARRYRQLKLDEAVFIKSQAALQRILERSQALTRAEIKAHFEGQDLPAEGQQLPYLLQRAALDGLICHGQLRGREPTYVLVADWLDPQPALERDHALGRLAERYFASHGPATQGDFAWWSGLSAAEARRAIELASEVKPINAGDLTYWATGKPPATQAHSACLLPPFDEYLLGYKDRALALDPAFAKRVNAGGGMPKPTLMLDGEILGTWSYQMKKKGLFVNLQPFRGLERRERDTIEGAASRLRGFLSVPVELSVSIP